MSYASWAQPDKTSGSGNGTVNWTGQVHTGRAQRTTTATFSASGVAPKTLTIKQTGATEFVNLVDTATVAKLGVSTLTIQGESNSSKLSFALSNDNIGLTLPTTYLAGGASTNNGAAIADDPGAAAKFSFSIAFLNVPANPGTASRTAQLTVTDDAGHTDTCTITQAAGDATLSIDPTEITLTAAGTPAVSVAVTSNTSWSIS